MPVDDGEAAACAERVAHRGGEAPLVGDAMKGIRHEYEIDRRGDERGDIIGVAGGEVAIRDAALAQTVAGHSQQVLVDVDRDHPPHDLGDLQREPAVTGAKVDDLHPRLDAHGADHAGRVGPQGLPPSGVRHLGPLEEARNPAAHRPTTPACAGDPIFAAARAPCNRRGVGGKRNGAGVRERRGFSSNRLR